VWQGEDVEEGVGADKDQAATIAHAEQVRAAQQLAEELLGSWCGQQGHAPRSRTEQHHQHAKQQPQQQRGERGERGRQQQQQQ